MQEPADDETCRENTNGTTNQVVPADVSVFENMETVSLELEEELSAAGHQEAPTSLDTVKFEKEAEESPPLIQSYFKNAEAEFDVSGSSSVATAANATVYDPLSIQSERQHSIMLKSYYQDPSLEDNVPYVTTETPPSEGNVTERREAVCAVEIQEEPTMVMALNVFTSESIQHSHRQDDTVNCDQLCQKEGHESQEKPSPELSKFFTDDRHGTDEVGKAFFDVLAQSISSPLATLSDQDSNHSHLDQLSPTFNPNYPSSEVIDCYSAWIPKDTTQQALSTLAATPPETYFPEKENLTMPGVIMTEELKDPVKDLARQCLGEDGATQRVTLTADSVSQDEEGLCKLMSVGCFRAAINLTTRLLTNHGQGLNRARHPSRNSSQSLQIWHVRLALLLKLRLFNMAEAESDPFGDLDRPDLYYEFYPDLYSSRKGSMVPFAFRTLIPQILTCVGKFGEAVDQLYTVLSTVNTIINNLETGGKENGSEDERAESIRQASLQLWKRREIKVLYSIANCLVAQNDFTSAYTLMETILEKSPQNAADIRSAQGRILLQLGDIKLAQSSFNLAASSRTNTTKDKVAILIDRALMCYAHNNFPDAYNILKEAQSLDANNPTVINNMAVCLLYMGKLRESFQLLESAIASNPKGFLHECIFVNVCTLYDLESSRSIQKKSSMLEVVNRYAGDGFNIFCLKLQNMT